MQVLELETKVEQLVAENRQLAEARAQMETSLSNKTASVLAERDSEIDQLKNDLQKARELIERLEQMYEGQRSSMSTVALKHSEDGRRFEDQMAAISLDHTRQLDAKDGEIARLRAQLGETKDKIRALQAEVLAASRPASTPDFLDSRPIDYFDQRCQQLCAHVQQWVLRFSKFSDRRAARPTRTLNDERLIDRLDNAVLDGTDVDVLLRDRVRRRAVLASVATTLIWELVFTRYLFGLDREQRQKLKALERQLLEVGPAHAVRQWRAVTLTLLARRPGFARQRDADTEAVTHAVLTPLAAVLPPPEDRAALLAQQLRRVLREAVALAVEMRCQRAEYQMLPPLQPVYDDAGELAERVVFNAALMQARREGQQPGGAEAAGPSGEELEARGATVRVVLFPLVVRKGDDEGRGEEELVVHPAQVLVAGEDDEAGDAGDGAAGSDGRRSPSLRLVTPSSDAGGASLYRSSSVVGGMAAAGGSAAGSNLSVNMVDAPAMI